MVNQNKSINLNLPPTLCNKNPLFETILKISSQEVTVPNSINTPKIYTVFIFINAMVQCIVISYYYTLRAMYY